VFYGRKSDFGCRLGEGVRNRKSRGGWSQPLRQLAHSYDRGLVVVDLVGQGFSVVLEEKPSVLLIEQLRHSSLMGCCSSKSHAPPASQFQPAVPSISVEEAYDIYAHGRDYLSDEEGGNIAEFFSTLDCSLDKAEGFGAFYVLQLSDFSKMQRAELTQFCRK